MKLKEDSKYKSVLTTSYVLCKGSPVTYVLYDEDEDWQLFGEEEIDENEDAYMIQIDEILEMEPALRKLPDLQPGQAAVRDKDGTRWYIVEDSE